MMVIVYPADGTGPIWWNPQSRETWNHPPTALTHGAVALTAATGIPVLILNSETGVILEYPSWSTSRVIESYQRSLRENRPPVGGQMNLDY
ncbi:hypothetical protein [Nocardia sp. GTS18]|uniref:hypothetical protein n=1 Tax=Nocardia sp. GTS18 TaxID=1778064 RepID=UPI0015EF0D72|nr:hypothetical protein [Nocardia sp. GTS18]